MVADEAHFRFLSSPGAVVNVRRANDDAGKPEIQLFGNRAGILSLANVLLWLLKNSWRREFLSFSELHFVHIDGTFSVMLHLADGEATGNDGLICENDDGEQYEWKLTDDDLRRVGLLFHHLACNPAHEYDRLRVSDHSAAGMHVRMIDARAWL